MKIYNIIRVFLSSRLFGMILCFFMVNVVFSQIKVGDSPQQLNATSLLELESSTKTFVLTRVTTVEMNLIEPLNGGLVYNIDEQCVFYYNGVQWNNLCSAESNVSIVDNGDDTYTVNDGISPPFTFDVGAETTSTLLNNENGTLTYTDETGNTTTFQSGVITDNNNGTYSLLDSNGLIVTFDGTAETITSLVDNGNGTFTYTNEANAEVTINSGNGSTSHNGVEGSVFFAGTDGLPNENNNQFYWDNVTNRLGIGTNLGLTDNLTINGTLGLTDGSLDTPSYRFSQDGSLGFFRNLEGQLAFAGNGEEKLSIDGFGGVLVNNANSFSNSPFVIRGKGPNQQLLTFQDANQGISLFSWDFRYPGLNLDEVNKGSRLFIKVNGFMGIDNSDPTESLDVDGTFRVRQLPASPGGLSQVVVDDNGVFYKSSSLATGKQENIISKTNFMARWKNVNKGPILFSHNDIVPLFGKEDFKDGGNLVFMANQNNLKIMQSGRYDLHANISLLVTNNNSKDAFLLGLLLMVIQLVPLLLLEMFHRILHLLH